VKNKLREKLEIQILCPEGTTKTQTHTHTHKPAVAKHTDAMPCQQRTKNKSLFLIGN